MMSRGKQLVVTFLILTVMAFVVPVGVIALIHKPLDASDGSVVEPQSDVTKLFFPSEWNVRQTKNACGVYAVSAAISSWNAKQMDPKNVARKIFWRLPSGYTLPWGIEDGLSHYGIANSAYSADHLSEKEKITFLQSWLAARTPIVLLGREHNLLHYVTLLGYEKSSSTFFVYDSLLQKSETDPSHTVDLNGEEPGNTTWTSDQLLDFWNTGGVWGFYKNYAVVITAYAQD